MGMKAISFLRCSHIFSCIYLPLWLDKQLASIVMNERAINNNVILSFLISLNVFCKVMKNERQNLRNTSFDMDKRMLIINDLRL